MHRCTHAAQSAQCHTHPFLGGLFSRPFCRRLLILLLLFLQLLLRQPLLGTATFRVFTPRTGQRRVMVFDSELQFWQGQEGGVLFDAIIGMPGIVDADTIIFTGIYHAGTRRVFFYWKARILFGGDTPEGPPPPNPPSSAPTQTKRVPICSFLNRNPSACSSRPETEVLQSYGAKTEIRTPMHTCATRHP